MNKLALSTVTLAAASAMVANAGITSIGPPPPDSPSGPQPGGLPDGPWSFEIPFTLDWTAGGSDPYRSANWAVAVGDDGATLPGFRIVIVEGQHLVAPHPGRGEAIPSNGFNVGVIFPQLAGSGGSAFGIVEHGCHVDHWLVTVRVDASGTGASGTVKAWHMGEPPPSGRATVSVMGQDQQPPDLMPDLAAAVTGRKGLPGLWNLVGADLSPRQSSPPTTSTGPDLFGGLQGASAPLVTGQLPAMLARSQSAARPANPEAARPPIGVAPVSSIKETVPPDGKRKEPGEPPSPAPQRVE
jgi:hypothetical protein